MRALILTLLFAFAAPLFAVGATVPAGIQGTLWFSKDPLPIGETIEVYATIYNSGVYDLNGEIVLFHGTTTLDTKPFTVVRGGGSVVVAFPFLVTPGSHTFSASLRNLVLMSSDSSLATIAPLLSATKTSVKKGTAVTPLPPASLATKIASSAPVSASADAIHAAASLATSTVASAVRAVEEISTDVVASPPARVIARTTPVVGRVEDFRVDQAKDARTRITSLKRELPSSVNATRTSATSTGVQIKDADWAVLAHGVTEGDIMKTPFRYVELFLLILWEFFTTHAFVFYGLVFVLLYKIVRSVLGVLF